MPYAVLHLAALAWVSPSVAKEVSTVIYSSVLSACGLQAWFPHSLLGGANSGTWSISVEFFFYALFPALLPLMAFLRLRWGALRVGFYLCALSGFIGFSDYIYPNGSLFYWLPAARLPEFMLGIAVGLELLTPARGILGNNRSLGLAIIVAIAAAINPVLDYGLWIRANIFVVPAFAWLIFELARWDQRSVRPLGRLGRVMVYLGESSYCLFLTQMIPMLFLDSPTGRLWLQHHWAGSKLTLWAGVVTASLAGAFLLHEFVEKKARRALLQYWRSPRSEAVT